jgi:hypothetical protein
MVGAAAEPTQEELFKIWAFKRALRRLRGLDDETRLFLANHCPTFGKSRAPSTTTNTAAAAVVAAASGGDDSATTSPMERLVAFLQGAAAHVTGRNMDYLNVQALFIFGVLAGRPECEALLKAAMTAQSPSTHAGAIDLAESVPVASSTTPAKIKFPSKTKLLAALAAQQFTEEPPKQRSKALPPDVQYDLQVAAEEERRKLDKKNARAVGSKASAAEVEQDEPVATTTAKAAVAKAPRPESAAGPSRSAKGSQAASATAATDELEVAEASQGVLMARKEQGLVGTRPGGRPVDESLVSKVARLVQILSVTTHTVLLERLRAQGDDVTLTDVEAAVGQLCRRELAVVEHGVVYPLC